MLTVSALSPRQLAARLAGPGIYLRTGAFVTHLKTTVPSVARGLALLYGDYPLLDQQAYPDFHLDVARPANPRRWIRPQVILRCNGETPFQPLPLAQAFPMFEWGLNWCVSSRAHDHLILHAAVLEKDGRALILPAPSGSGKSTLCAALAHAGWRLLSDELTLVRLADGAVVPQPRPVSLKNASIDVIRRRLPHATFSPAVETDAKGTVAHLMAPADSVARAHETARPAWIVFPRYAAGAATTLTPLAKSRTHLRVAENAFNYSLLAGPGFEALGALVDGAGCYDFEYSSLDEAIAVFAELTPP